MEDHKDSFRSLTSEKKGFTKLDSDYLNFHQINERYHLLLDYTNRLYTFCELGIEKHKIAQEKINELLSIIDELKDFRKKTNDESMSYEKPFVDESNKKENNCNSLDDKLHKCNKCDVFIECSEKNLPISIYKTKTDKNDPDINESLHMENVKISNNKHVTISSDLDTTENNHKFKSLKSQKKDKNEFFPSEIQIDKPPRRITHNQIETMSDIMSEVDITKQSKNSYLGNTMVELLIGMKDRIF